MPKVSADPNKPIEIKIGVPINTVSNITIEFIKDISKSKETKGIKIIIGKHVKIQHEIILKNKISSIEEPEVKYNSITPLSKSSLKKLLDVKRVVNIAVTHIIPGIIFSNKILSGPNAKGKIDIIRQKNINGKKMLFKFLKYVNISFLNIILIMLIWHLSLYTICNY